MNVAVWQAVWAFCQIAGYRAFGWWGWLVSVALVIWATYSKITLKSPVFYIQVVVQSIIGILVLLRMFGAF